MVSGNPKFHPQTTASSIIGINLSRPSLRKGKKLWSFKLVNTHPSPVNTYAVMETKWDPLSLDLGQLIPLFPARATAVGIDLSLLSPITSLEKGEGKSNTLEL